MLEGQHTEVALGGAQASHLKRGMNNSKRQRDKTKTDVPQTTTRPCDTTPGGRPSLPELNASTSAVENDVY